MSEIGLWSLLRLSAGLFLISMVIMHGMVLISRRRAPQTAPQIAHQLKRWCTALSAIAFVVGGLCIYLGFQLNRASGSSGDPLSNTYALTSIGAMFVAWIIAIRWFIGDRSYGRARCPKCWYDMSDRVSLTCPECGRDARREHRLNKTRRRKRNLVLAVLITIPSAFILMRSGTLFQQGWRVLISDRVLMIGWAHLPESWIIESQTPGRSARNAADLESRIRYLNIPEEQLIKFGEELSRSIMDDPNARWDRRRVALIAALSERLSSPTWRNGTQDYSDSSLWHPESVSAGDLCSLLSNELIDALVAVEHDQASNSQQCIVDQIWESNLLWVAFEWFAFEEIERGTLSTSEYADSHKTIELLAVHLSDQEKLGNDPAFQRCLSSENDTVMFYSLYQLYLRDGLDETINWYREHIDHSSTPIADPIAYRLPYFLRSVEDSTRERFLSSLAEWAHSSNPDQIQFAISFCARTEFSERVNSDSTHILDDIGYQRALTKARELIFDPTTEIGEQVVAFASYTTPDGQLVFQLAAKLIREGREDEFNATRIWASQLRRKIDSRHWVEHISPVIDQADTQTLIWLSKLAPRNVHQDDLETIKSDYELMAMSKDERLRESAAREIHRIRVVETRPKSDD